MMPSYSISASSVIPTSPVQNLATAGSVEVADPLNAPQSDRDTWRPTGIPLIKHIPKAARPACAMHLAKVLHEVATHPDTSSNWITLFNWGSFALHPPERGGKHHNLTAIIKKHLTEFRGEAPAGTCDQYPYHKHGVASPDLLAKQ